MTIRRVDCPDMKAEGTINSYPYNTELVNSNGVWFHIWLGDKEASPPLLVQLERKARGRRDVVRLTYSDGQPPAFWAHENF